jgi:hypothetical protein
MQRGVVCSQGLPIILQLGQVWSFDRCATAQNRQALVEHLSPIWPNFWQLVHCVVGETFRYLYPLIILIICLVYIFLLKLLDLGNYKS